VLSLQMNHWVKPALFPACISLFLTISFILLLCSAAQKMKDSLMKTSSRHASPRSSACGVVFCSVV
jgi:hypothetical protein